MVDDVAASEHHASWLEKQITMVIVTEIMAFVIYMGHYILVRTDFNILREHKHVVKEDKKSEIPKKCF